MAEKYVSAHTGQEIDSAVTKALNPSTTFNSEDAGKLADAKAVGELVNAEKERAEATYLPYDGYSQLARVGEADVADNLTPYSSDNGTSQNTPFILQGSGCANGEEQADTGSYCQLQRKNGNTVTVNQLVRNPTFVDASIWSGQKTTFTVENNVAHVVCGEEIVKSMGIYQNILEGYQIPSHKYLLLFTVKPSAATKISAYYAGAYFPIVDVAANANYWYSAIITLPQSPQGRALLLYINYDGISMVEGDYADISNVSLIDLTLWFGSNDKIPTHLLNHPEDFFRYYQGDLSYNEGTLTDCNGRYLKTTGRNAWDEEWEVGSINNIGQNINDATRIRTKNYISVIPSTAYFLNTEKWNYICCYDADKNFVGILSTYISHTGGYILNIPSNIFFIRVRFSTDYGTTYKNDITISLYYEGESGYDQYYPYEELANIDTGDEALLAFDYKTPDGVVHKNTGRVDLGSLTWTYSPTVQLFSTGSLQSLIKKSTHNVICAKYTYGQLSSDPSTDPDKTIFVYQNNPYIKDSAYTDAVTFKAAMSGVYLEYELAEPTTEQGTPFPENVAIDDFGAMAFDCPNGVPQGNTIFYSVDYKAEIDTLHNITEGDMHKIALKGDNLAPTDPDTIKGVVDAYNALYAINQENMGGTLRHMLADKAEIDFANTAWVDLGTLTYSTNTIGSNTYEGFSSQIVLKKPGISNFICSQIAYLPYADDGDYGIRGFTSSSSICIRVPISIASTPEGLKAAMKGILLAYEKATT